MSYKYTVDSDGNVTSFEMMTGAGEQAKVNIIRHQELPERWKKVSAEQSRKGRWKNLFRMIEEAESGDILEIPLASEDEKTKAVQRIKARYLAGSFIALHDNNDLCLVFNDKAVKRENGK